MADKYPKINSVWKRDEKGNILPGQYSTPEIEFLARCEWLWTEKVDGTNIRLSYQPNAFRGNEIAFIQGRTDNAQIPPFLLVGLVDMLRSSPLEMVFPDLNPYDQVVLYGEGYGAKIQKGGGNYIPDGVDFVLFDVKIEPDGGRDVWLQRDSVEDIAQALGWDVVPVVAECPIAEAQRMVRDNLFSSQWDGVRPEGLVGVPKVSLFDRRDKRIMTKIKWKDFE